MKKSTIIVLGIAMSVMLTACGNKTTEATKTEEPLIENLQETAEEVAETAEETVEEATEEEEVFAEVNTEGCDTFTQIVDRNLLDGQGYANEPVGDTDVFFVCSGAFDDGEGNFEAIDSTLLIYKDDAPTVIGNVSSSSTACPISIKDKVIYAGGNHGVSKYTVANGELVLVEMARVSYDTDGNATYYYQSGDEEETEKPDSTEFDRIFEEYGEATPVYYSVVKR